MSDLPPALTELIKDEDRENAKTEFRSLIRQMQKDGIKTRSILRALLDVMIQLAVELPSGRHYDFLRNVRDTADDGVALFELFVEKERNTNH